VKVAIVIPAYNESSTISQVVNQVKQIGIVIVVDDASSDATSELAEKAGAVVVRHNSNRGYDGALQSGFEKADQLGVDSVITFDADGQHDPAVLDKIVADLKVPGMCLVLGIRPAPARLAEAVFNFWTRLRFGVNDILCGLKGYRMDLYRQHGCFDHVGSIGTELALSGLRGDCGFTTIYVPISDRDDGQARFGSSFRANIRIFRAFLLAIWEDVKFFISR